MSLKDMTSCNALPKALGFHINNSTMPEQQ